MNLPRYLDCRETGVTWLGDVPAHWKIMTFQRCVYIAEGQVNPEESPYRSMLLIAPNHVESGTGRLLSLETAEAQAAESGKYLCRAGDVIYSKIRPALRKVCLAPEDCLCSADMYPLRGDLSLLSNQFLMWFMLSEPFSALAVLESERVAMPKINRESLKEVWLAIPPIDEQAAIVAFLDSETGKIDVLISEQEKLLALLAEKRQATISHAVTRGLNPGAPMKSSCVAWLGQVPEHWRVRKVGLDGDVLSGFAFPSAGFSLDDSDVKLLRGVNVGVGALRWDDVVYWNRAANDGLDAFELRPGDIVLGMDRPWISEGLRVARVSENDIPCLLLQRVAAIRPGTELNADYLYFLLQAGYFFHHCSPEMTGVSVP